MAGLDRYHPLEQSLLDRDRHRLPIIFEETLFDLFAENADYSILDEVFGV